MKHNRKTILHVCLVIILAAMPVWQSCDNAQVYGNQLQDEKELIKSYIKRNNINIIKAEPVDSLGEVWGENDYLEIDDYLYFHLVSAGDTDSEPLAYRDYISLRYRRYTLDIEADTVSAWNTNDSARPVEFQAGVSSDATCEGWMLAIAYMKYNNSECKLICPSKLGFTDDSNNVIPYVYDLKIKVRK